MKYLFGLTTLLVSMAFVVPCNADIVSGDFRETLDLVDYGTSGARVLESLAQPLGAGLELDEGDEITNPSGWDDSFQVDLTGTGMLTLTPTGSNVYQTIDLVIENIMFDSGEQILGVSLIDGSGINDADSDAYERIISFTSDSISISYANLDFEGLVSFGAGSDVYSVRIGAIPEPSSMAVLSLIGLVGTCVRRRK